MGGARKKGKHRGGRPHHGENKILPAEKTSANLRTWQKGAAVTFKK